MKEADIAPLALGDLLRYLGLWILMSTYSVCKRDYAWSVTPFDQEANTFSYCLEELMYKRHFNDITRKLRLTNTNPPPDVDKFW